MYYLRTRAAADAIQFTVDQTALKKNKDRISRAMSEDPETPKVGCTW